MRVGFVPQFDRVVAEVEEITQAGVEEAGEFGGAGGKDIGVERKHGSRPSSDALYRARGVAEKTVCIPGLSRYVPRSFMAKMSWINRNERKRATVKKYAALRAELKAKKDYMGLSQLPRDASPTRVVNRCEVSGRRRAFIRRFKISRLTFRELASGGFIPGVTKSSW